MAKLLEIFFASAEFIVEAIKHPQQGFRLAKGEAKEDWDSAKEYIQGKVDDAKEVKDTTQKGYRGFKSFIEDLKTYAQNVQDKAKAKRDLSRTPEPQQFVAAHPQTLATEQKQFLGAHRQKAIEEEASQNTVETEKSQETTEPQPFLAQHREVAQDQDAAIFETAKPQKTTEPKPFLAQQREVAQDTATKSEPVQATTFEPAKPQKETGVPKTFIGAQREMAETTPQSPPPLQEAKQFTSVDEFSALESVIEPLHNTLKQLMNGIESASKSDKPLSNDGQSNQQIIWQALETALNCASSAIKLAQKEQLFQISSFGANAFMQAFTQGTMPVEQQAEETTPVATMIRQGVPEQKTTKEGFGIVPPPPPPVAPGGEAATPGAPAADASSSTNAPAAGETEATPTTSVKSSGSHGGRK